MFGTDVGDDGDRGRNHRFQGFHLAAPGNAGLEDTEGIVRRESPKRQRDTDAGIIAAWTAAYAPVGRQYFSENLLYDGLSAAAGDSDYFPVEFPSFCGGIFLEGPERGSGFYEPGAGIIVCGKIILHDEMPHSAAIKSGNKPMAVAGGGFQGEENGMRGIGQRPRISKWNQILEHPVYSLIFPAKLLQFSDSAKSNFLREEDQTVS